MRGDNWIVLLLIIMIVQAVCLTVLAVMTIVFPPEFAGAVEFSPAPKDRPVLETVQQVWEARTTGTCDFWFDGNHYIVENLPKHYIDYSSWYVRMP